MEKKNLMSLLTGALVAPVSVQAATQAATPVIGFVFMAIAPVIMFNKPYSLVGAAILLLTILLEAYIISRVIHVAYRLSVKRMLFAHLVALICNAFVGLMSVMVNFFFFFGEKGFFQSVSRKGAVVSDEHKAMLVSRFTLFLVVTAIVVVMVKMLLEYLAFRRFGLSVESKVLVRAVLLANAVSYVVIILALLVSDYLKIDLLSL